MRDILFRGKSVETGEWEYGDLVHFRGSKLIYIHTTYGEAEIYREVGPDTVGQYTGFIDINKEKIFEGDILKAKRINFGIDKDLLGVVFWDAVDGRYYLETVNDWYVMDDIDEKAKIVSNKWDNPELLDIRNTKEDDEE